MKTNQKRAEKIIGRAYDMYPLKHKPDEYYSNCFPMYSFERAGNIFWRGFAKKCFDDGLTEHQTEWLLRSKLMRWMFDGAEDELEKFASTFVTDSMVDQAKREA